MRFYAPEGVCSVYHALAFENRMLEDPEGEEGLLFCWTGERAVVMGKNQNPWRECNLKVIREGDCRLARRVSGGGTVYHDPGNLNVSWILPREGYRPENMHRLFIRALARLGVQAEEGKGGSLTVDGKKISGSAFCYRRDRVLHHGTLLLNADLNQLQSALSPREVRMQTHAVDSEPAPVMNLGLEKRLVMDALRLEAEAGFGPLEDAAFRLEEEGAEKMATGEWIWGQTPAFRSQVRLPEVGDVHFLVRKGKLVECEVGGRTPALERSFDFPEGPFYELEQALGCRPGEISESLNEAGWRKI